METSARPARLFDKSLYRRRLARALSHEPEDFLAVRAQEELFARLAVVRRRFSRALDLGSPFPSPFEAPSAAQDFIVRAGPLALTRAPGTPSIAADEENLPFAPESFDLVFSLLGLQWANDLPGALIQARRVLKPDGLFIACLLGGESLRELRESFLAAEAELTGGAHLRVAPFADLRDMGGLLQRAGFSLPVADSERITARYETPFGLLKDLRAMGAGNFLLRRAPLRRAVFMRAMEIYGARFADPDGRARATFEFIWLSGWAPHDSQPKPARPGSARASLEEAVKAQSRS